MVVEPVSITPVHLSHTVTVNLSSQKITENTVCLVTLMDSETNTQRHINFISVASDPLKGPVLNGTVTSHSHIQRLEKRQYASHFELNHNTHADTKESKSQRLSGATWETCLHSHRKQKQRVVFYSSPLRQQVLNKMDNKQDILQGKYSAVLRATLFSQVKNKQELNYSGVRKITAQSNQVMSVISTQNRNIRDVDLIYFTICFDTYGCPPIFR